jgi:hypothetical protein
MSKWTDGEIEFLRINWKRSTHREMGEAINKSAIAVRAKCWRLGFVSDRLVGTDKIERIKVWYAAHQGGKLDLKALSVELTMSQGDICKIARRHGPDRCPSDLATATKADVLDKGRVESCYEQKV